MALIETTIMVVIILTIGVIGYGFWNANKHKNTNIRIDNIDVEIDSMNKKFDDFSQDIKLIKSDVISTKKSVDWIKIFLENKN